MCSRKKIGARMEPWRSAPLMEYSCENFLSRTTCNHLLLKNEKIRLTWNSRRFRFIQKPAWLYQKPCIYHVLQLKQPQICWKHRQFCQTHLSEEQLKKKTWNFTDDQKTGLISGCDQEACHVQVCQRYSKQWNDNKDWGSFLNHLLKRSANMS